MLCGEERNVGSRGGGRTSVRIMILLSHTLDRSHLVPSRLLLPRSTIEHNTTSQCLQYRAPESLLPFPIPA